MTDEQRDNEHSDFSSPFGFYAVPVDPQNLPPFLRNLFEASAHCAERGYHCKCWQEGDTGTECCRCGAVKNVSVPPPRLTSCRKLEAREVHYAHKKRWPDGEVTECGGYNPPPDPLEELVTQWCAVCGVRVLDGKHVDADGKPVTDNGGLVAESILDHAVVVAEKQTPSDSPELQAPPYVWPLVHTILTGQPVNFKGLTIPEDLRHALEAEVKAERMNVVGLEEQAE